MSRARERERERERERGTDRDRQRQTETERETETDTQRQRHREKKTPLFLQISDFKQQGTAALIISQHEHFEDPHHPFFLSSSDVMIKWRTIFLLLSLAA